MKAGSLESPLCAFSEHLSLQVRTLRPDAPSMADEKNNAGQASFDAESYAKGLYARTLSQWTLDLLHIRAHNLDVPSARRGEGVTGMPFAPAASSGLPLASDCEKLLQWSQRKAA
jgi:hypothetical protein